MSSFELSKLQAISPSRALSENDRPAAEIKVSQSASSSNRAAPDRGVALEVNTAADASSPPVNTERVAEIRAALRDGSYPLVPTKIADAMIAAKLSMGIER